MTAKQILRSCRGSRLSLFTSVVVLGIWSASLSLAWSQTKQVPPQEDLDLTFSGPVLNILNNAEVTAVAFSADSKEIAVASRGSLWFGDAATGKNSDEVKNLPTINHLCYALDGKRLAAACEDNTVKIFDTTTHKVTLSLNVATNRRDTLEHPRQMDFSPDGKLLAVIDAEDFLTLWTTDRGQSKGRFGNEDSNGRQFNPRGDYIRSVMFAPDGKRLATVVHIDPNRSGAKTRFTVEIIWRSLTGRVEQGPFSFGMLKPNPAEFSPTIDLSGHQFMSMAQSADGGLAALSGAVGSQQVFDLKHKVMLDKLNDTGTQVLGFSADNTRLIAFGGRTKAYVFHVPQQRLLGLIDFESTGGYNLKAIAVSPDGKHLATGGSGVQMYDLTLLKDDPDNALTSLPPGQGKPQKPGVVLDFFSMPHLITSTFKFESPERILALAPSPDGKTIALGTQGKSILLFDRATEKQVGTLEGHKAAVNRLKFSPQGGRLVSGSSDGTHQIWDVAAGKSVAKIPIPPAEGSELVNNANQLSISADGSRLTIVTPKGVALWDLTAGKSLGMFATELAPDANAGKRPLNAYPVYTQCVGEVLFAPDGSMATAASSVSGKEWGLGWRDAKGATIAPPMSLPKLQLRNGYATMPNMAFSPDGNLLAIQSQGLCEIYRLQTKEKIFAAGGGRGHVVGFANDGDRFILTVHDVHNENPRKLLIANHRTKERNLTIELGQGVKADSVALSADGRWLIVADTYRVRVWDLNSL